MKFLHLADLHIGKKLNEYPLFEDQRFVLNQALSLAKKEDVDAIVIAGDIYDSSAPTAEAMEFYDNFLSELHDFGKSVLMISGNHDSSERLHVASAILKKNNIFIVTRVEDALNPICIEGVNFYLLPYFRPSEVNYAFGPDCRSYASAMAYMVEKMDVDVKQTNVLVTHQSILPLGVKIESSGSETAVDVDGAGSVGGTDTIDVKILECFDYLALGHIHKAQFVAGNARYAGALLKYHTKEANAHRSFTIVDIQDKKVEVKEHPLTLLRDLVILEGTLEELLQRKGNENDYVYARLLDEINVDSPYNKLKAKYQFFLGLEYAHNRTTTTEAADFEDVEKVDKTVLFSKFFSTYGGRELDQEEEKFVKQLFEEGKQ